MDEDLLAINAVELPARCQSCYTPLIVPVSFLKGIVQVASEGGEAAVQCMFCDEVTLIKQKRDRSMCRHPELN